MKLKLVLHLCAVFAALFVVAGCATNKVDWNARIGHYTFDQAVTEFGPPDKQARLSDGRNVAEWVTRHYPASSLAVGTGFYGYPGGVGYVQTVGPNAYETRLRLTFNTNNILDAWSKH
jgi:hypothetical protein